MEIVKLSWHIIDITIVNSTESLLFSLSFDARVECVDHVDLHGYSEKKNLFHFYFSNMVL